MKTRPSRFKNDLPRHVAIIMDGNGRWALAHRQPRVAGHREGVERVREIIEASVDIGIPILTLYAFSQENWKRPKSEVNFLMKLLGFFIDQEINRLNHEGVCIRTLGRIEELPTETLKKVEQAVGRTRHNTKLILNIALNYGARREILDAVEKIAREGLNGGPLTEEAFSSRLYTASLPDPDLLIRTSGEMRVSNFLLWQISYSEIYITKKFWPDFRRKDYLKAIREYQRRERRFGDVVV